MLRAAVLSLELCDTFEPFRLQSNYQETSKLDFLRPCVPFLHEGAEVTWKSSPHLLILTVALIAISVSKDLHAQ